MVSILIHSFRQRVLFLELLTDDKVELASAILH